VHLSLQKSSETLTARDRGWGRGGVKGREKGRHAGPPARDGAAFAICKEPGLWDFCQLLPSLILKKEI